MLGHALCHALSFHSQTITHSITNNQSYYQNNQSYRKTINPTTDLLLWGSIYCSNTTFPIRTKLLVDKGFTVYLPKIPMKNETDIVYSVRTLSNPYLTMVSTFMYGLPLSQLDLRILNAFQSVYRNDIVPSPCVTCTLKSFGVGQF